MTIAKTITEWRDDCPGWGDDGKRVLVLRDDGSEFEGVLSIDDVISNGEGDEMPMFYVNLCSGEKTFLLEHEGWRFV